jgi:hypothetical protein
MNDGIESAQILRGDFADVATDHWNTGQVGDERAFGEVAGIKTDDIITLGLKPGRHDRTDIAVATGDHDAFVIRHERSPFV